jgi:DNA-binding HxlR family transcriptional regulator
MRSERVTAGLQETVEIHVNSSAVVECSAHVAINLIQGKWKTRIISRLEHGPARLGELRRMFPEASKKMLAQHLREMEEDGLVVRRDLSDKVLHVEYSLSASRGVAILYLVKTLRSWSKEHLLAQAKNNG